MTQGWALQQAAAPGAARNHHSPLLAAKTSAAALWGRLINAINNKCLNCRCLERHFTIIIAIIVCVRLSTHLDVSLLKQIKP